jgi:hypothetical protein
MRELRVTLVPSETETRLWARDTETGKTIVRARLPPKPTHPLAVPWLLEALGCFLPVRAALVVTGARCTYATRLYPEWFGDFGGPHYELHVAASGLPERALRERGRR